MTDRRFLIAFVVMPIACLILWRLCDAIGWMVREGWFQ